MLYAFNCEISCIFCKFLEERKQNVLGGGEYTLLGSMQINPCIGSLFALYGSTEHPAQLCCGFWTIFVLLSV